MKFPQYRKYKNGSSYFKIVSETEFEEVQLIGKNVLVHHISAVQLPELWTIRNMLELSDERWVTVPEEEYLRILNDHEGQGSS